MADYIFSLPPIDDLEADQRFALNETGPIAVSGPPGTGKTVVSLWRHLRNLDNGINSLLLTYTKTLEYYLKATAHQESSHSLMNIDRTIRWVKQETQDSYDEILVDEAQDVNEKIYEALQERCKSCSYGADNQQRLYTEGVTCEKLNELFPSNKHYSLEENFRNSKEILLFTKALLPNYNIPYNTVLDAPRRNIKPFFIQITGTRNERIKASATEIMEISEELSSQNIGILVPSVNDIRIFYNDLLKLGLDVSRYHNEMIEFQELKRIHITTFKSAKGLEFDTVIIPVFSFAYLSKSSSEHYVALTRAKTNLYILTNESVDHIASSVYEFESR